MRGLIQLDGFDGEFEQNPVFNHDSGRRDAASPHSRSGRLHGG